MWYRRSARMAPRVGTRGTARRIRGGGRPKGGRRVTERSWCPCPRRENPPDAREGRSLTVRGRGHAARQQARRIGVRESAVRAIAHLRRRLRDGRGRVEAILAPPAGPAAGESLPAVRHGLPDRAQGARPQAHGQDVLDGALRGRRRGQEVRLRVPDVLRDVLEGGGEGGGDQAARARAGCEGVRRLGRRHRIARRPPHRREDQGLRDRGGAAVLGQVLGAGLHRHAAEVLAGGPGTRARGLRRGPEDARARQRLHGDRPLVGLRDTGQRGVRPLRRALRGCGRPGQGPPPPRQGGGGVHGRPRREVDSGPANETTFHALGESDGLCLERVRRPSARACGRCPRSATRCESGAAARSPRTTTSPSTTCATPSPSA